MIMYGRASYVPGGSADPRESSIKSKFTVNSLNGWLITLLIVPAVSGLKDRANSPEDKSLIKRPE